MIYVLFCFSLIAIAYLLYERIGLIDEIDNLRFIGRAAYKEGYCAGLYQQVIDKTGK